MAVVIGRSRFSYVTNRQDGWNGRRSISLRQVVLLLSALLDGLDGGRGGGAVGGRDLNRDLGNLPGELVVEVLVVVGDVGLVVGAHPPREERALVRRELVPVLDGFGLGGQLRVRRNDVQLFLA